MRVVAKKTTVNQIVTKNANASRPAARKIAKKLESYLNSAPEVLKHFEYLVQIIDQFPLEVSISYLFGRVELAHNITIYCGVVKIHKVNASLAQKILNEQHITRDGFQSFYKSIFGEELKLSIKSAEKVRDRVMHGKTINDAEIKKAVNNVIEYAHSFNKEVYQKTKIYPFGGDLRGFKGRARSLSESTSRWVLKGMGFKIS